MALDPEIERFVYRWVIRTEQVWLEEMRKHKVGDTDKLRQSFHNNIMKLAEGHLNVEFSFLTRGRFVDAGKGRGGGSRLGRYEEDWGKGRKGRRKKPWYSRALYARVNSLMGATGAKMSEQSLRLIKENFPKNI